MLFWSTLVTVGSLVCGNLLIRAGWLQGTVKVAPLPLLSWARLLGALRNWRVLLGGLLVFAGVVGWLIVISLSHDHWGYLALSLSYMLTILCAWWFLGETLTLEKMFGAIIILIGLLWIAQPSGL